MNKLTLDLNALTVQSFTTDDAAARLFGTVHGRQQKGQTGEQDTDCSAVDACPSARGCSEVAECPRTKDYNCPSAALHCATSRECSKGHQCSPSEMNPCISEHECTQVGCAPPA